MTELRQRIAAKCWRRAQAGYRTSIRRTTRARTNKQPTRSIAVPRCKAGNLRMIEILVPRIGAVAWSRATLRVLQMDTS